MHLFRNCCDAVVGTNFKKIAAHSTTHKICIITNNLSPSLSGLEFGRIGPVTVKQLVEYTNKGNFVFTFEKPA